MDIVEVEARLEELINYSRDKTLNILPEFEGLNPSIEHFARLFCRQLRQQLQAPNLSALQVRIWENEIAWTSYREVPDAPGVGHLRQPGDGYRWFSV